MNCGDPSANISNLNAEYVTGTAVFTIGASATVICKIGFRWTDSSVGPKALNCTAAATWTAIPGCASSNSLLIDFVLLKI